MTKEQILEELKLCKQSPLYFISKYVKIKNKHGETVDFLLNYIQKKVYKALKEKYFKPYAEINGEVFHRFQKIRLIIVKYRQVGISTMIAALILHEILFWRGTEAAIFLHKDSASKKMLSRLKDMLNQLPSWMKSKSTNKDLDSKSELAFAKTGAKLTIGTPGKSSEQAGDQGRSETLHDVLVSEMPRYPYQDDFLQGILAAAKNGNVFIESTPLKRGDLFHGMFKDGRAKISEWLALFFPWFEDPLNSIAVIDENERDYIMQSLSVPEKELMKKHPQFVTVEKIKWRRHTILNDFKDNERRFVQEYPEDEESCFASTGFNYFDDPEFEIKRVTTQFKNAAGLPQNFRDPIPGHFHVLGVDCAMGLGGKNDYSVISIIDYDTQEQVFEWRRNDYSDKILHLKIYELWQRYPGVIAIENNEIGHGVLAALRKEEKLRDEKCFQYMVYRTSHHVDGFRTGSNKPSILSELYTAIKEAVRYYVEQDSELLKPMGLRICSDFLTQEMGTFVNDGDTLGAERSGNNHDDTVMAIAIAWQMMAFVPGFRRKYLEFLKEAEDARAVAS